MRTSSVSFALIVSVLTQLTLAANFKKVPSPDTVTVTATVTASPSPTAQVIKPKVFIISFFTPEATVWQEPLNLTRTIKVPGFSPLFPNAYCNPNGSICQVVTGEGEINGASSISALIHSRLFDLTTTYFLTAGIAGINPACGTLGTVALAKYTVQVGLAYEVDSREIESNYTSGWIPLGAKAPNEYPVFIYGTEVYELSTALRDRAYEVATKATLEDSVAANKYRKTYPAAPANLPPTIIRGDTMTSDVYWHGNLLGNTFEEYTNLLTNSSGRYCMTAQEDNAVLEAMLRGALSKLVDFGRIIVMRTGANFDRPPPHETALQQLLYVDSGGFNVAVQNIYAAGRPIVDDIVNSWSSMYEAGIPPVNYIGNVLGSLEGQNFAADIGSPYYQEGRAKE